MTFIDINIIEGQNEKELITFHDISSLLLWLSLGITYHIHILYAYDFVSLKRFYDFPFIFQATHLWVGSCLFIWPSAIYLVYVAEWYSICLYVNENSWIWNDILNIACLEYLCMYITIFCNHWNELPKCQSHFMSICFQLSHQSFRPIK